MVFVILGIFLLIGAALGLFLFLILNRFLTNAVMNRYANAETSKRQSILWTLRIVTFVASIVIGVLAGFGILKLVSGDTESS